MSYSKLHSSIVNSSLWCEQDAIRILFITLLAMCDRDGIVYGSRAGLARAAMIDPEKANEAWTALLSPDPDSSDKIRAPENEGRRIEEVSGGFRLLNFEYYRGLRNDDERREQNRAAQAKFRVSQRKPESAKVSHGNPPSSQAEAEAEAEAEADTPPKPPRKASASPPRSVQTDRKALRLGYLFGRKAETQWEKKEIEKFNALQISDDDLEWLTTYYVSERKNPDNCLRKDLGTLLNNFQGEIDRARNWKPPEKSASRGPNI